MEIHTRDDRKIVEVWRTKEDQQELTFEETLRSLCRQSQAKPYIVAVFSSGTQDLAEETSALLRFNRKRSAELEAKRSGSMAR